MSAAGAGPVGAIGEGVAHRGGMLRKGFEVIHLKCEVGQVRPDHYRAAGVVLANLDQFLALRAP